MSLPLLRNDFTKVEKIILFDRPTKLEGEDGLMNFLQMFTSPQLKYVKSDKEEIYKEVENKLKPKLYHQGVWTLDYVRLRVKARKQ